jgi:hypothetical protein
MSNSQTVATQESRRARDDNSKTMRLAVLTMAALCVTGTMMLGSQADSVSPPVAAEATARAEMLQLVADDLRHRVPAPALSCGPEPWLASSFSLAAEGPDMDGLECQCRPVSPGQTPPGERNPGQGGPRQVRPGELGPGPVATLTAAEAAAGRLIMVSD